MVRALDCLGVFLFLSSRAIVHGVHICAVHAEWLGHVWNGSRIRLVSMVKPGIGHRLGFQSVHKSARKSSRCHGGDLSHPVDLWGLHLVTRQRDRRSLILASLLFLGASTTAHYFLVTTLFLSPFFVVYALINPEFRAQARTIGLRFSLAILPAVVFLGLNFAFPVPPDAKIERADSLPRGGETVDQKLHPYLFIFAARPIDYLAGDLGLVDGPLISIPARAD